jgi:transketolase
MAQSATLFHIKPLALGWLAIEAAGSGYPTTARSLAHMVSVLMYRAMHWNPKESGHRGSDRLVPSEGHAVPIIYAPCADLGAAISPGGKHMPSNEMVEQWRAGLP